MIPAPAATEPSSGGLTTVRILTYNTLSQSLINRTVFPAASAIALKFKGRFTRLVGEIKKANADILCLQEVDQPLWGSHWAPTLHDLGELTVPPAS